MAAQQPTQTLVTPYRSPLGPMAIESDGRAITGLRFVPEAPGAPDAPLDRPTRVAVAWLDAYFAGKGRDAPQPPVKITGTPFQVRILETLAMAVPYGTTITYQKLARLAGVPRGARAVGAVMARNPLHLLVPCHRVIGSGPGRPLTGYAAGTTTKGALLELERGHGTAALAQLGDFL